MPAPPPVIPPQIQAAIQGAKVKKRIEPVLLNAPASAADGRIPTAGQQRMLNTISRMEKHYKNPTHNLRNVVIKT